MALSPFNAVKPSEVLPFFLITESHQAAKDQHDWYAVARLIKFMAIAPTFHVESRLMILPINQRIGLAKLGLKYMIGFTLLSARPNVLICRHS